ncbi:pyocin knob domain-containing protein [Lentilactobacillus otakiensis]|uniref:pyocin knob domain-containing protein n=1 Tax=Lentilactobacillus otakiensis TaxID=481720 RepID=UPI003D17046E
MQKFDDTVITDNGLNLLTSVNGGDDKIKYTKAVLASDDLTQAAATAIQKITTLSVKMSSPISINSRINDTINLSASFTNAAITEDFDFYCIGWYAKGIKDSTEYLIAVSPSTVKQTMPAGSNNAATASIEPKYAMALSRNAEVVISAEPAGSVTKGYVDSQINELKTQGIINSGSIVSTADDCNKMITTSYHLVKGSLPLSAPEGFSTNGQIIVYGNKDTTDGVTQVAYDDINGTSYVRSYNPTNNKWSDWDLVITKSQLNAVLPTDIARTGEDNDFKGKNTFETDPVNKNGNSYGLAKDIATKVTDNGDNSIEINKQAVTPVRDNKNGSINFNSKDMTPADDSAVVHTTGNETINGQKKFDTDPTDGAGNAYAKTVDVNQQLGKKVNVTDMRKPASDVVGLEDVSTSVYQSQLAPGTDIHTVTKDGIYPLGWTYINFIDSNHHWGTLQVINSDAVIIHIARIENGVWYEVCAGSPMKWGAWYKLSTDEEVAHLSGANNFDTVPTVNNNPLLLASSLPPDLARTGANQEFTGKNKFDTAPIDKTTGNPYITKDGVPSIPSDVARTGQANTFTAAQTFSIAPVINDASTDKGDNQAATMADLKSVENSAWHQLNKGEKLGGTLLYKIDQSSKKIYLSYSINSDDINGGTTIADFSSIVKNIKTISGGIYCEYSVASNASLSGSVADLSIGSPASIVVSGNLYAYQDGHVGFFDGTYFTYDSLVN